jgi:hypothetical protein
MAKIHEQFRNIAFTKFFSSETIFKFLINGPDGKKVTSMFNKIVTQGKNVKTY